VYMYKVFLQGLRGVCQSHTCEGETIKVKE
jgi:hypothetical protein